MLQFDVELCCIRSNLGGVVDSERTYHTPQAHLSACACLSHPRRGQEHAQAGKVRRYKNGCSVGVYLRRWSELASNVEGFIPKRTHVANTNKRLIHLLRISAFLPLSSLKDIKRRLFMN